MDRRRLRRHAACAQLFSLSLAHACQPAHRSFGQTGTLTSAENAPVRGRVSASRSRPYERRPHPIAIDSGVSVQHFTSTPVAPRARLGGDSSRRVAAMTPHGGPIRNVRLAQYRSDTCARHDLDAAHEYR